MIDISNDLKTLFKSDSVPKYLKVLITDIGTGNVIIIENDNIYYESFKLRESIVDGSNWEFTGCIASEMSVKIRSTINFTKKDWEGALCRIQMAVLISAAEYDDDGILTKDAVISDYIPLFYGYIDKCEKDADRLWQTITCYDALYSKFNTTAFNGLYATTYQWYNKFFNKKSKRLYELRESLFENLGIEVILPTIGDAQYLPNDDLIIRKRFKNKDMTVLEIMQGLCQINGCFGRMTREGKFQFLYITNSDTETLDVYRKVVYQDAVIQPIINGITMRNNSDDAGITVTDDRYASDTFEDNTTDEPLINDDDDITSGNYILDGNMFAYKLSKKNKRIAISKIYKVVGKNIAFKEYKAESNGIPYLECGDKIAYETSNGTQTFIVTNRKLSGIQSLKDTYDSSVDKTKTEYISTAQKSVSSVKTSVSIDEATDVTNNILQGGGVGSGNLGYMYVVSWDATTGILNTSSGVATSAES